MKMPCGLVRAEHRLVQGLTVAEQGPEAWEPFYFMQMADTQLGFGNYAAERKLLGIAVAEINRLRPTFAIVCGDLTNAWPAGWVGANGRQHKDPADRAAQVRDFKEACSRVDPKIPLVCVCGNHDIGNRPNAQTIDGYRGDFGDDHFTFWIKGVKCIVLNSQLWKDDSDAHDLRTAHDAWLHAELDAEDTRRARHVILFSHIAPFLHHADEPGGYFNIDPTTRGEWLHAVARSGATTWFCGHWHRNGGGVFTSPEGRVEVVVTSAAGSVIRNKYDDLKKKPTDAATTKLSVEDMINDDTSWGGMQAREDVSGMRIVAVTEGAVQHKWWTYADLHNLPDGALLAPPASAPQSQFNPRVCASPPLYNVLEAAGYDAAAVRAAPEDESRPFLGYIKDGTTVNGMRCADNPHFAAVLYEKVTGYVSSPHAQIIANYGPERPKPREASADAHASRKVAGRPITLQGGREI